MAFTRDGDRLTWRFHKDDLGITRAFSLSVSAGIYGTGGNVIGLDFAPDHGNWSYAIPAIQPRPVIALARQGINVAVAGRRMTLRFSVTDATTGRPLATGILAADPAVDGRVLPHAESFSHGEGTLQFVVPRRLKGKKLRVRITITAPGGAATRTATFRIR